MTHNALQTLWGSGDPERDEARKNTAKSMISPSIDGVEREQQIYTPNVVLDVVREVWPEGIACDPCHGPDSQIDAEFIYDGFNLSPGRVRNRLAPVYPLGKRMSFADGRFLPWPSFTYCNPPYKDLSAWLAKACTEAMTGAEIIVLCPVRTHRRWFRSAMLLCDAISYMDPLMFVGFKQAFPAPLCLMYWGVRVDAFMRAQRRVSR